MSRRVDGRGQGDARQGNADHDQRRLVHGELPVGTICHALSPSLRTADVLVPYQLAFARLNPQSTSRVEEPCRNVAVKRAVL
jgi:hypothetical protein